jgi:hypothetical protein
MQVSPLGLHSFSPAFANRVGIGGAMRIMRSRAISAFHRRTDRRFRLPLFDAAPRAL